MLLRPIYPYEGPWLVQMAGVGSDITVVVAFWLVYRRPSVGCP
jgi:hypothetical protein